MERIDECQDVDQDQGEDADGHGHEEYVFQDKRKQAKMELIFRFEQTSGCK